LFDKILVPLDGSRNSAKALKAAILIAKKFDGKITLIHVYSASACRHAGIRFDECVQGLRKVGARILANGEKKAEGIEVETLLMQGHIVEEIIKTAREGKFDLVVMGARGLSRIKELLLGSVSSGVTRHARCPVLVVK